MPRKRATTAPDTSTPLEAAAPAVRSPRTPRDRYDTDGALTAAVVPLLGIQAGQTVLEPHVGGGAWVGPLLAAGAEVHVADLDPEAQGLRAPGVASAVVRDFLQVDEGPDYGEPGRPRFFDWVVGNPPFANLDRHVVAAFHAARNVAFVCRITWLMSSSRAALLAQMPPRLVLALSPRPSFTGDGSSDQAPSVVVVWSVGEIWETRWLPVLWRRQPHQTDEVDADLGPALEHWAHRAGNRWPHAQAVACREALCAALRRSHLATAELRGRRYRALDLLPHVSGLDWATAEAVAASVEVP